jgi:flagellar FliL protein
VVRKPSKTWIWVTVLALILVIASTGGYIYFSGLTGKKASVMTDVPETLPKSTEKATSYEDTSEKIAPKMEDTEINKDVVLALEPFVVNLSDSSGARFLKVSLQIEFSSPVLLKHAKAKTHQIRDAIINILTSKTSDMLISPEGKLQLKNEINIKLNQIVGENSVKNIYFVDFVMQ